MRRNSMRHGYYATLTLQIFLFLFFVFLLRQHPRPQTPEPIVAIISAPIKTPAKPRKAKPYHPIALFRSGWEEKIENFEI